jgi:DNA-binding MarR family transcriptional regulator
MAKTRWLNGDERQAWRNLTLMQFQLFALIGRELAGSGLSYQDYVVLAELADRPDNEARLTELGRQVGWEKSRISHHVTRMEQRGLVTRVKCPTDQRGWFVHMTTDGRQAMAAAAPDHVAVVRRHFVDLLSPAQLRTVGDVARKVLDHLPGGV